MRPRVLLVEDDAALAAALERGLAADGYDVRVARSLETARAADPAALEAVVADVGLPDGAGTDLLGAWRARSPDLPVVVVTGAPTVETAVESLRGGAFDYLSKPVSRDALRAVLGRAIEASRLRREVVRLRAALAGDGGIVGASEATRRLRARIASVARAPTTVLVEGESGTGKELVARALHAGSGRTGPFVPVNCAALPEALLESELFGHRKGAFTGAVADRKGLVAEAEGGTLLLDEIGELPAALQAKLLRFLQDGEYRPVGAERSRRSDVRVVAATNRDLGREVAAGRFREDLYWRLAVVRIDVPPLRDRPDDIEPLVAHFLGRHAARLGKEATGIAPAALARLQRHAWPGNVRELENVLERAVLLADGPVVETVEIEPARPASARPPAAPPAEGPTADLITRDAEAATRERLVDLLRAHGGSVTAAARAAGRNRTAFYGLLKRHGLDPAAFRAR